MQGLAQWLKSHARTMLPPFQERPSGRGCLAGPQQKVAGHPLVRNWSLKGTEPLSVPPCTMHWMKRQHRRAASTSSLVTLSKIPSLAPQWTALYQKHPVCQRHPVFTSSSILRSSGTLALCQKANSEREKGDLSSRVVSRVPCGLTRDLGVQS